MEILGGIGTFFFALVIALVVEAVLEYVFGIWWRPFNEEHRPKILMAAGLALGIALCLAYKIDLLAELGLPPMVLGQILTGALVGRGSSFLHDFLSKVKPTG